ncbi:MAG: type I-E CRISPR-associated protein Cas6/Cse3/CasE [candidate division Zixibacteria bacterium]|jgi:CRISPR system Cascade subunit CasE|nr:type I-E CRISPR-associated protein Cas6/Cse3/CasE [candidate division Zixibacteria bacterium]
MKYFSRITVPFTGPGAAGLIETILTDKYKEHQLLWELFPGSPDATRDFLFRQEIRPDRLIYYVLSGRLPQAERPGWIVETKSYSPNLRSGQRFLFSIRVNPVVKRRDDNNHQVRHDVVMDTKWKLRHDDKTIPDRQIIQESGRAWLERRSVDGGFILDGSRFRADAYVKHVARKGQPANKLVEYSTLDMRGLLTITDPTPFLSTLHSGIGPSKAFGCGLLLIKPV